MEKLTDVQKRLKKAIDDVEAIDEVNNKNKVLLESVFKYTVPSMLTVDERIREEYIKGDVELNTYLDKPEIKRALETQQGHCPIWMLTRDLQLRRMMVMMSENKALGINLTLSALEKAYSAINISEQIRDGNELMSKLQNYVDKLYVYVEKQQNMHENSDDKKYSVMMGLMQNIINMLKISYDNNTKIIRQLSKKLDVSITENSFVPPVIEQKKNELTGFDYKKDIVKEIKEKLIEETKEEPKEKNVETDDFEKLPPIPEYIDTDLKPLSEDFDPSKK